MRWKEVYLSDAKQMCETSAQEIIKNAKNLIRW